MTYNDKENYFWPRNVSISDILISSAWTFISWLIWSILIIIIVFFLSNIMNIPDWFSSSKIWTWGNNPLFPFILSFITFLITVFVTLINYYFLTLTDPEKYKKTMVHFWNILFFSIIVYLFFAPVYIYLGIEDYNYIVYIFIIHILLLSFWEVLLLEILNNYRYILLWFYASFVWLFLTSIFTSMIFSFFTTWYAKLLSLLLLLPLVNWFIILFKWLFEIIYYKYYKLTWNDQLWDVFRQIENQESQELREQVIINQKY